MKSLQHHYAYKETQTYYNRDHCSRPTPAAASAENIVKFLATYFCETLIHSKHHITSCNQLNARKTIALAFTFTNEWWEVWENRFLLFRRVWGMRGGSNKETIEKRGQTIPQSLLDA